MISARACWSIPLALLILSCFAFAGVLPKYFNSEWSVAQFRLQEGSHYIVAFGHEKNTVIILGMDGRYDFGKWQYCLLVDSYSVYLRLNHVIQ